ncbi:MAG: ABC transporter permease [Candidatus Omnitrophica bacterium]|nr:ABC transporter permease [Candidatus Omnitrophota bacterium]
MSYELFLAVRYLTGLRRSQPVVSVIAGISVLGIALGVAALLVVLGVMTGFDADLEAKIIGANPHLLVQAEGGVPSVEETLTRIESIPGVEAASPVLQVQMLLRHAGGSNGVLLRGVDPERESRVTRLVESVREGSWPPGEGEIFLGSELAKQWLLRPGDVVEAIGGEKGKAVPLRVAGSFSTGMYEYDMHLAITSIRTVRGLLEQPAPAATGIGVRLVSAVRAPELKRQVQKKLGYPYWTLSWMDLNSSLFAALKLEKITMFLILTLIVLVACFNIVATLLMLVVGKTKEIGILKAIGATAASTRRVFTLAGLMIGVTGTVLGGLLGLGLCAALAKYQFIRLPADIYYLDHLPVKLELPDALTVTLAALFISWAACLYPAWVAARMVPARALRYE